MRILAIASASRGCMAAVVSGDDILAEASIAAERGLAEAIPPLLAGLLKKAGPVEAIAVVVGPGSFTGLRAGISVGTGIALAAGIPIVGVTVAEALGHALLHLGARSLWVASASRRGHVVLNVQGVAINVATDALPTPTGPVAVAGDAANAVAAALAARGADVMLTSARTPLPHHVAVVGASRLRGELPPCPALPLYSEAPRVTVSAAGPRPPPVA